MSIEKPVDGPTAKKKPGKRDMGGEVKAFHPTWLERGDQESTWGGWEGKGRPRTGNQKTVFFPKPKRKGGNEMTV